MDEQGMSELYMKREVGEKDAQSRWRLYVP